MSYTTDILALNPLTYHDCQEPYGASVAVDQGSAGSNATSTGGVFGHNGPGLGLTSCIQWPSSTTTADESRLVLDSVLGTLGGTMDTAFTACCWLRFTSSYRRELCGTFNDGTNTAIRVTLNTTNGAGTTTGAIRLYQRRQASASNTDVYATNTGLNDGQWHFLAIVNDGSNWKIYIDGDWITLTGTTTPTNGTAAFQYPWAWGNFNNRNVWTSTFPFNGALAGCAIFDTALSKANLDTLYAGNTTGAPVLSANLDPDETLSIAADEPITITGGSASIAGVRGVASTLTRTGPQSYTCRVPDLLGAGGGTPIVTVAGTVVDAESNPPSSLTPTLVNNSRWSADQVLHVNGQKFGWMGHFNMFTFVGPAVGVESVDSFAPTGDMGAAIDQWIRLAKAAGMTYMVLTIQHHSGFKLWPSAVDGYHIGAGSWYAANSNFNIAAEFRSRVAAAGLSPWFYYSVWDRHFEANDLDPATNYLQHTKDQLDEIDAMGEWGGIWSDGYGWASTDFDSQPITDYVPYADFRAHLAGLTNNPGILWAENNHNQRDIGVNTDVDTYEGGITGSDGIPDADNLNPANVADTARGDGHWAWEPNDPARPTWDNSLIVAASTIRSALLELRDRRASFLLNFSPDPSGRLPAKQVALLGTLTGRSRTGLQGRFSQTWNNFLLGAP